MYRVNAYYFVLMYNTFSNIISVIFPIRPDIMLQMVNGTLIGVILLVKKVQQ